MKCLGGGDVDVVAEVDLVVVDAVGGVGVGGRAQAIAALLVFGQFGGGGDVLPGRRGSGVNSSARILSRWANQVATGWRWASASGLAAR